MTEQEIDLIEEETGSPEEPIKIAAVIMTLNEEHNIEGCITTLRPFVDYILVVDGGSTDHTVLLAEGIADKVITHKSKTDVWVESYERNYAWRQLPDEYEWTLWVDADETFHFNFLPIMRNLIKTNRDAKSYRFPRANLPTAPDYPDYQIRFVKNHIGLRWANRLHSTIVTSSDVLVSKISGFCMTMLDLPIWHKPRRTDLVRPWWNTEES